MELTVHQQEKMQELIQLIKAGHKRITLTAKAGCGKTFMVNELIYVLKTELYKYGAVYITAPTHKALTVLQSKIEAKPYIQFKTIHSAHQLKRKIDFKSGITSFEQIPENPKRPRFAMAQVVIVDESTMLEAKMLEYNDQHPNLLFIFVGDPSNKLEGHPGQLPPVNEKASPIFTQGYPDIHLTEIVRQGKGSPIIALSNNLKLIHSKIDVVNEIGGYIFDNNRDYIINKLAEVNGSDDVKYVAWRNIDVDQMNYDVRKKIYGSPGRIESGEGLVFAAPYRDYKNNEEFKVGEVEIIEDYILRVPTEKTKFAKILNSDDITISEQYDKEGVRLETYLEVPIKVYKINPHKEEDKYTEYEDIDDEGNTIISNLDPEGQLTLEELGGESGKGYIYVLHEESDIIFKHHSSILKHRCKLGEIIWPAHYWFEEQFAGFKYNHAISCHKSQGSTYQTVIINVGDIELNRRKNPDETNSMLYTAITRAAKLVVLYNVR